MDVVLKLRLYVADARLIYRLIKPLRASDLIEFVGEAHSHDANDGFRKLRSGLASELPPPFIDEVDQDQEIYVATRLDAEEVQALKRCIRHQGFFLLLQAKSSRKLPPKTERVLFELLQVLETTFNLYDEPYQGFDRE